MENITEIEWAYIAGMIDADGCIQAPLGGTKASHYRIEIHLIQKYIPLIYCLYSKFGGSVNIVMRKHKSGIKHYYRWMVTGPKCLNVLIGIEPFLILKKKQAQLGIELGRTIKNKALKGQKRNLSIETINMRESLSKQISSLNSPATTECDGTLSKEMRQSELMRMKNHEMENRSIFHANSLVSWS